MPRCRQGRKKDGWLGRWIDGWIHCPAHFADQCANAHCRRHWQRQRQLVSGPTAQSHAFYMAQQQHWQREEEEEEALYKLCEAAKQQQQQQWATLKNTRNKKLYMYMYVLLSTIV